MKKIICFICIICSLSFVSVQVHAKSKAIKNEENTEMVEHQNPITEETKEETENEEYTILFDCRPVYIPQTREERRKEFFEIFGYYPEDSESACIKFPGEE